MATFALIYSFNVFLDPIAETFDRSTGQVSLIFALQSIVSFGGAGVLGLFIDRYGNRRLLFAGGVIIASGLFVVSQANTFLTVILVYGIVVSVGIGLTYVIAYATPSRWFHRRRGIATAIAVSGSSLGIVVGSPVANALIVRYDWQTAYLVLAGTAFGLLMIAALLIADSPASFGVDTDSEFPDGNPQSTTQRSWNEQLTSVYRLARRPTFVFTVFGFLFVFLPAYVVMVHIVSHTANVGIDRQIGVFAVSFIGAMNIVGKFAFGSIADRIGEIRAIVACAMLVGFGTISYAFVTTAAGVLASTFVFGLGYGGSAMLISPILVRFFGHTEINTLTGAVSVAFAVSGSVGPYLAGVGFDVFGTYVIALVVGGGLGLCGGLFFKAADWTNKRDATASGGTVRGTSETD